MKQEKDIGDGIVYRGEGSIYSNFHPAPFVFEGVDYLHVEQYYQHAKALHHNEVETAERIMNMSNPNRIKALGDGLESDKSWMERRMLVLYDGVKAKFEQNWLLQEELLSTKGKQLYEATTDQYFGCGIGFESKRWQQKDWLGENVAGLVVRKVILGIPPDDLPDNTLTELRAEQSLSMSCNMDTETTRSHENQVSKPVNSLTSNSQQQMDSSRQRSPPPSSSSGNDYRESGSHTRGQRRGRGRGRGRGFRGCRLTH